MTRDDVIRMAREAGLSNEIGVFGYPYLPELERFAKLAQAAEREACEKMLNDNWYKTQSDAAAAIRARRET